MTLLSRISPHSFSVTHTYPTFCHTFPASGDEGKREKVSRFTNHVGRMHAEHQADKKDAPSAVLSGHRYYIIIVIKIVCYTFGAGGGPVFLVFASLFRLVIAYNFSSLLIRRLRALPSLRAKNRLERHTRCEFRYFSQLTHAHVYRIVITNGFYLFPSFRPIFPSSFFFNFFYSIFLARVGLFISYVCSCDRRTRAQSRYRRVSRVTIIRRSVV